MSSGKGSERGERATARLINMQKTFRLVDVCEPSDRYTTAASDTSSPRHPAPRIDSAVGMINARQQGRSNNTSGQGVRGCSTNSTGIFSSYYGQFDQLPTGELLSKHKLRRKGNAAREKYHPGLHLGLCWHLSRHPFQVS
ncbi:hypothetical protein Bbelb_127270 [Branchiostoma belcheri]|nr:hypothetical protein Bbelb_127270 [Branchiostoma belcheri]